MDPFRRPFWMQAKCVALLTIILFVVSVLNFQNYVSISYNERIMIKTAKKNNTKVIYIWGDFLMGDEKSKYNGNNVFKTCRESRCLITGKRQQSYLADAIIFPWVYLRKNSKLPKKTSNQIWIFFILESPATDMINRGDNGRFARYNNLFNWTMTYRTDSDIFAPYAKYRALNHKYKKPRTLKTDQKTKIAAAFISNCQVQPSGRNSVLNELKRYIQVDIFGNCGELKCSRNNETACWVMAEKSYKFYLAFENSICKDYMTEKFANSLKYDIVPVVLGGGNYKKVAPPHSFIDVTDFKSIKGLAMYLRKLHKNDTLYREYLQWKGDFEVIENELFCELCEKLHSEEAKTSQKSYKNMKLWWHLYPCYDSGKQLVTRKLLDQMYSYNS